MSRNNDIIDPLVADSTSLLPSKSRPGRPPMPFASQSGRFASVVWVKATPVILSFQYATGSLFDVTAVLPSLVCERVERSLASSHMPRPAIRRGSNPVGVGRRSLGFMPIIVTLQ